MRPDPLEVAKRALQKYHPNSLGGIAGGSVFRGEGTPTSDIDVVVLYDDAFADVHRASVVEEGWPIEFFVQSIKAQDYFLEKDRLRGMCVMASILCDGTMIPNERDELISRRRKARDIIDAGPPALTPLEIDRRRYALTNLIGDLCGTDNNAVKNAVLSQLHDTLGDFHLRSQGCWSGHSKALLRSLKDVDETFASRYVESFDAGFSDHDIAPVVALADDVLQPYGGRLWEGYKEAPGPGWRQESDDD
jgi:predicted nucleotidyltransferase